MTRDMCVDVYNKSCPILQPQNLFAEDKDGENNVRQSYYEYWGLSKTCYYSN